MAADELDQLYKVKPDEFTALRTRLAAAAKDRGDAETAKLISASRKPTTAAWVVNLLIQGTTTARRRLTELGEGLRAAHTAMDGDSIRRLSAEHRRLVAELTRDAFDLAGLTQPSAAMRDDVTDTLYAAVADPDVAAGLGRLTKAQRYSGFGSFADTAAAAAPQTKSKPQAKSKPKADAETKRDDEARAAVAAAEEAKTHADDALSERQAELAAARQRHDEARELLEEAEQALAAAEAAHEKARQVSRDAAGVLTKAQARLKPR